MIMSISAAAHQLWDHIDIHSGSTHTVVDIRLRAGHRRPYKAYIRDPYDGTRHRTGRSWAATWPYPLYWLWMAVQNRMLDGRIRFMYGCTGISIMVNKNIRLASRSCLHLGKQLHIRYQNYLNPRWFSKSSNLDRLVAGLWRSTDVQCVPQREIANSDNSPETSRHPPSVHMLNLRPLSTSIIWFFWICSLGVTKNCNVRKFDMPSLKFVRVKFKTTSANINQFNSCCSVLYTLIATGIILTHICIKTTHQDTCNDSQLIYLDEIGYATHNDECFARAPDNNFPSSTLQDELFKDRS